MTLILATVVFLAPDSAASDTACVPAAAMVSPLSHVTLWGHARYDQEPRVLGTRFVNAGQLDSIEFEDSDSVWTVWTTVTSTNGRESCRSEYVGVNMSVGVDPWTEPVGNEVFDLSGRKVKEPRVPGVYFRRDAYGVRRLVVLR